MTKEEAIKSLKEGNKITHSHFLGGWIRYKAGWYFNHNDKRLSVEHFWNIRTSSNFNKGYELFKK